MNKTITRLENDYPDKRTISKHQYQTHRPFEGAEPVRRSRPLTVFSAKKFEKTMINREIEQKTKAQSSIRFVSMIASLFGAANRTRLHYCVGIVEPPPRDSPPDCPIGWVRVLCDNKKQTPKPGICFPGAANGNRTRTVFGPRDFKC